MSAEESATRDGALLSLGGWLFPVGTAVDIRTLANPSHVFEIGDEARKIHDRHQSFLELEVEYLPALVPLKELVHSGRLPPGIDRERLHGPGRRLRRQMRDDDRIDLFDLTPVLMDAAAETDAFEPRADQLSPTGAWRAARAIAKGLGRRGRAGAERLPAPLQDAAPDPHSEHLGRKQLFVLVNEDLVPVSEDLPVVEPRRMKASGTREASYQVIPAGLAGECDAILVNTDQSGALVVRVAKGARRVAVHLAECFERTWIVPADADPFPLVQQLKPDVIVDLIDERGLSGAHSS